MLAFFRDLKTWGQVGVVIGLLGGLAGAIVAIVASPIFGTAFTLVFVAIFYMAFRHALGPYAKQKALAKSGEQAEGTILSVEDTGVTVNEIYPLVKIRLEVRPPHGDPYEAETKLLINRTEIPQVQPGAVVPVLYDPRNTRNVTVGVKQGSQAPAVTEAEDPERLRMAEEFLAKEGLKNKEIRRGGKPAMAKVLSAMPLGINVNGNNPAMTFLLEVRPDRGPSFQAQTTGVIAEESVPDYLPGREIFVKYDPDDNTRVSLDQY